jgi:heparan-alpha-glucosaminide N-acetyltransferase
VKFLFYAVFYSTIGGLLSNFSKDNGFIPINKNLWSLSYVFVMAGICFLVLIGLYTLIDIYDIYSGTPFLYLGRNSITIYICHEIFVEHFPFFQVDNTHGWLMFKDLYGVVFWSVVAALMNFYKVYINF